MNIKKLKSLYAKKDKIHNWNHILKIRKNLRKLLNEKDQSVDKDKLDFLVKYHGLKKYVIKNKETFTKEQRISLLRHSKNPLTKEEKLVHDANLLDMENSVDRVTFHSNSPDRGLGTKYNLIILILCNVGIQGIEKAFFIGKEKGRTREETLSYIKKGIRKAKFCTQEGKRRGQEEIKKMRLLLP